jgi:hypothetical protein
MEKHNNRRKEKRNYVFKKIITFNNITRKLGFFIGKSNKKIPNLNMHKKYHSIILDKLISTCPL